MKTKTVNLFAEPEKARLKYEQQAVNAYETMQRTGYHVTSDELKKWVNSLNSSHPKEPPVCHS
jgi:hypothetical protein